MMSHVMPVQGSSKQPLLRMWLKESAPLGGTDVQTAHEISVRSAMSSYMMYCTSVLDVRADILVLAELVAPLV